ncbi:MAG: cytochrome c family protein [Planctomycetota bacterium]|jgi:hypothetical protein
MRKTSFVEWCSALVLIAGAFVATAPVEGRPVPAVEEDEAAKPEYVGDKACVKCHFKQHKSWKKTELYKSMKSLEPTTEEDAELFKLKKDSGLDPAKDYTTDAKCLACHTTGYGKKGGYPEDPEKDAKKAKLMGKVSCEACHGPGSLYSKHKTAEVKKDKKATFTAEQLKEYGLTLPDENNCKTCHNENNPTNAADDFKFEKAKEGVHTHVRKKK